MALYHTVIFKIVFACFLTFTCLIVNYCTYSMSSHSSLFKLKLYSVCYCVTSYVPADTVAIFYTISLCNLVTEI